jgi:hypothetical protein
MVCKKIKIKRTIKGYGSAASRIEEQRKIIKINEEKNPKLLRVHVYA